MHRATKLRKIVQKACRHTLLAKNPFLLATLTHTYIYVYIAIYTYNVDEVVRVRVSYVLEFILYCTGVLCSETLIIVAILLWTCEGKRHRKDLRKSHRLLLVILNITLCSLDFNISAVCTTASDKGHEQH